MRSFLAVVFFIFSAVVKAQTVQDDWIAPTPPDNSTAITIGETFTIKWDGHLYTWFSSYAPNASVTNSDLWVTGFYDHQYQHLVASKLFRAGFEHLGMVRRTLRPGISY